MSIISWDENRSHSLYITNCTLFFFTYFAAGGLVVISVREDYLTEVAEYKDRLEPLMKQLETEGTVDDIGEECHS